MAQLIGENNNFQLIEPIFRCFSGIGYIWGAFSDMIILMPWEVLYF